MFENVTYIYYSDTMGRSTVPDEDTFNKLVDENELEFKKLYNLGIIDAEDSTSIDKAVCMMIEVQYQDEQAAKGASDNAPQSESVSGYSYSLSKTEELTQTENFKTTAQKKMHWIELYCDVKRGVL